YRPELRRADSPPPHARPDLPRPGGDAAGQDETDEAHPGEVRVARHAHRADDVAVDVRPARLPPPPGHAHASCSLPSSWPAASPRTTLARYVTAGLVASSRST